MAETADLILVDNNDKTTFKQNYSDYANSYDHIYATYSANALVVERGQAFDVTAYIFGDNSVDSMKDYKRELSDHLPVFFKIRP